MIVGVKWNQERVHTPPYILYLWVAYVVIVACHHPLFCCMDTSLFLNLFMGR